MVVLAIVTAFQLGSMRAAREREVVGSVSIRVVIVQPGENLLLKDENVEIFAKTTAFEVLESIAQVGYREYPGLGKFVISIDNVEQTEDKWWLYQVNGVYPNVAADRCVVADGDNILWEFTSEWPAF